jgi:hypothetical protein
MANAFDDLLGSLVNKLKGVGIGSRTAAQNRAEIDYMTPSNRAAQAGQATRGGPTEYYDLARRTDYNYKAPEYSQTMPLNRGMFSGSGLGLAAPADTYSAAPQSSVDRPSLGRGMYGMGTTPSEGPFDASVINPVFSGSDMDAIMTAGGRPTDSSSVFTTTDAETGKEVIVDAYGNAFFVPPASKTRPGFENETGNLNIPGMFDYAFGSDGRGAILDDATALTTGVSYARDVEGNPASFIADGIGGMFSAMDARANPGVTDQAVRRETATTKRNIEEERITIAQQLQEEKGYTRAQMASPFVQRQIEERLNKIVQEREIEQTDSDNLGVKQEVLDLADLDFGKEGSTIELDPSIVTVGDKPTNAEIVKTLNEDYANLAASGADSATLSELAREIDSYRNKEVSFPSIVSEAAASDVVKLNGAKVVGNQWSPTPPTTFSSVKGYAGKEAIEQVEATYGPLNDLQKFLVEKEGYYPGWYKDTVGVATVGVGQTGKYAAMTPIEAMNAKIKEVKVKVPVFKDLSLIEQKALIDAHYRGDINNGWKNKYVTYIKARTNDPKSNTLNSLKQKSYDELWNNESYIKMMGRLQANKSKDGDKGVMTRVRKWMKDLFQDDQAPAAIQARIDKYAKTL